MTAYTTRANVRLLHRLFTDSLVPDDNVDAYLLLAQAEINSHLGINSDLSDAVIAQCNVRQVADAICAIYCVEYIGTVTNGFTNVAEWTMALDAAHAKKEETMNKLQRKQGFQEDVIPKFPIKSNTS